MVLKPDSLRIWWVKMHLAFLRNHLRKQPYSNHRIPLLIQSIYIDTDPATFRLKFGGVFCIPIPSSPSTQGFGTNFHLLSASSRPVASSKSQYRQASSTNNTSLCLGRTTLGFSWQCLMFILYLGVRFPFAYSTNTALSVVFHRSPISRICASASFFKNLNCNNLYDP